MRIANYPPLNDLEANSYWAMLNGSLMDRGCQFVDGGSGGIKWLWKNRGKVDVLHYHFVQMFYAFNGTQAKLLWVLRFMRNLIAARLLGFRTIYTLHDLYPTWPLKPAWVDDLGYRAAVILTSRVIVHCQAARHAVRKMYGRKSGVYLVHHPNYCDYYPATINEAEARLRLGIRLDQTVYGFLGGLRPNKGIDGLIRAFREMKDEDAVLLIAGKLWPPYEYQETLLRLIGGDGRIRLEMRYIPDEEIQVYLKAADIVVCPFREILTSGSVMLALSFGKPVIAPAMGCIPEQLGTDCGVLYNPDDPDGLLDALQSVKGMDLNRLGRAALERVRPFTPERFARETMQVYGAGMPCE